MNASHAECSAASTLPSVIPCSYPAGATRRTQPRVPRPTAQWPIRAPDGRSSHGSRRIVSASTTSAAARQIEAAYVFDAIQAAWVLDDRTRSNVYATVQTLVAPWSDPIVAESAQANSVDLDWLLAGANTLYICAPQHEQARLAPVFGGLIGDLIQQAFERAGRENRPLPPTLVVLDEAANTPARWLPGVASTCAGIGLLLVTIWQSKSQIDAAYGRQADSVITNHGTKIIFSGVSDHATLDYAARLLGDEDVLRRSTSLDLVAARRSVSDAVYSTRLVPAHVLRQVRPGEALLIHGTLPPAHLHARPYYRERHLRALANQPPTRRVGGKTT
jgi:type IV secretion system protein VirD4